MKEREREREREREKMKMSHLAGVGSDSRVFENRQMVFKKKKRKKIPDRVYQRSSKED